MIDLKLIENYTSGFFGGLFSAIFIAIILGQNPLSANFLRIVYLIFCFVILYFFGLICSSYLLNNLRKRKS